MSSLPVASTDLLSVSVVLYKPDLPKLAITLRALCHACERLRGVRADKGISLILIDNGQVPDLSQFAGELIAAGIRQTLLSGHGNVGYGRGHNLALRHIASQYHLVLNPDIDLDPEALVRAVDFLDAHPEAGLLAPWIGDESGEQQYLCRRVPSVLDLLVRGFLPQRFRRVFASRIARYEMRDVIDGTNVVRNPPIVSGCFMFFRTNVLAQLGGFDPRYFLYFEDYDLSLRAHEVAEVVYVPLVRVVHFGGNASRKGFAHIRMFGASAVRFFNRFGWRWL
ncbi:glycosyltransferase [Paraburkholderia kirstenboschensis]|uniref:Glycosyltransferase n=2 Tax=Paraburkholderia kirstenboschensis TaxID=1245436 RepID=A0ABZ0EWK9_9BURK|nr:glycosyltransferase [Paraburkholderia kirstenboschensis]WOD20872.1 glycosyltransferase [Paraburkholderia kirstenboschensis]